MIALLNVAKEFDCTKPSIETLAQLINEEVDSGNTDPLKLSVQLTALIQVCEAAKEKMSEKILNELAKSQGKAEVLGAKIERKETGTKYDYSESEAWIKISEQEKIFVDRRKAIEAIAKNAPEGTVMNVTDEATGETWEIKRASKSSKTSFAITLGK